MSSDPQTPPGASPSGEPSPATAQPPAEHPPISEQPLARISRREAFVRVYDAAKQMVGDSITTQNAVTLIAEVMRAVESVSSHAGLTGPEKKALAIDVVDVLVDELVPEHSRGLVKGAVSLLMPGVIDAIVSAAKGQLGFAVEQARRGASALFPCC